MRTDLRDRDPPAPISFSSIDDRFQVIFDSVNDGIFVADPLTGRFIEKMPSRWDILQNSDCDSIVPLRSNHAIKLLKVANYGRSLC